MKYAKNSCADSTKVIKRCTSLEGLIERPDLLKVWLTGA